MAIIIPLIIVAIAALVAGVSFLVMHLWNTLIPDIFGLREITFWEALGLLVLSKILFGGFRPGYRRGRHSWRQRAALRKRWMNMSEEERANFRKRWKEKCGPMGSEE